MLTAKEYRIVLENFSSLYAPLKSNSIAQENWQTITRSEMARRIIYLFTLSNKFNTTNTTKNTTDNTTTTTKNSINNAMNNTSFTPNLTTNVNILIQHTMYPFSEVKQ